MIHNPSSPPPTGPPPHHGPSRSESTKKKELEFHGKGGPVTWGKMQFSADDWKKFMKQLANSVIQQIKHEEDRRKKLAAERKQQEGNDS